MTPHAKRPANVRALYANAEQSTVKVQSSSMSGEKDTDCKPTDRFYTQPDLRSHRPGPASRYQQLFGCNRRGKLEHNLPNSKKCQNVRQKLGTRNTLSHSQSLTLSIPQSLNLSFTLSLSHSLTLSFTHSRHGEQLSFSCLCSKVTVYR